ncbi:MAG: hypothetical protein PHN91_02960, partial [Patescibacteria group bacterium]|nr:hypothetical protein [Patescibacteria group bacterium]
MSQRSGLLTRKKVRHRLRFGLITGLIAGSFLLAGNVKALTDPLIYQKPVNGTLTATEWNNLLNDFVAYRDGGRVGIGTTTPSYKLDVVGSAQFSVGDGALRILKAGSGYTAIYYNRIYNSEGFNLTYWNGSSETSGIKLVGPTGNVGIGTTAPGYKLDVSGTGRFTQPVLIGTPTAAGHATTKSYVDSTAVAAAGGGIPAAVNGYTLRASGTSWVANSNLYNDGTSIGIGTTNPTAKLQVISSGGANTGINLTLSNASSYAPIDFYTPSGLAGQFVTTGATFSNGLYGGDQVWLTSRMTNGATGLAASGANGYIKFATGGEASTNERMRITSSGNVGIGTTVPKAPLDIKGYVQLGYDSNSPYIKLGGAHFDGVNNAYGAIKSFSSNSGISFLTFWTSEGTSQERMRISYDGNVGIGTTAPAYKLDVSGTGRFTQPVLVGVPTADGHAATKNYVDSTIGGGSGSTVGYWTMSGANIYNSNTTGNVGIGTTTPSQKLSVNGNMIFSGSSGRLYFPQTPTTFNWIGDGIEQTGVIIDPTNDGTSERISFVTNNAERLRINAAGNVGIGTINPVQKLEVKSSGLNTQPFQVTAFDGSALLNVFEDSSGNGSLFIKDAAGNSDIVLNTAGSSYFNGSNVGIGTTAPGYKLDVSGTGRFTQPVLVATPTLDGHAATKNYVDSTIGGGSGSTVGYWTMSGANI